MLYPSLRHVTFNYPAIDNHAHPLLKAAYRSYVPFEGLISEAQGPALLEDSPHTLACYRATAQLAPVFGLEGERATWEGVKEARDKTDYDELCKMFLKPTGIQCVLFDDLFGDGGIAEGYKWHDQFTKSPSKRIVRVEVLAQGILSSLIDSQKASVVTPALLESFISAFSKALQHSAADPEVVGFKSVACYRTGLNVAISNTSAEIEESMMVAVSRYQTTKQLRIAEKAFNDLIVRMTCEVAGVCKKPIQFHTGLGDNDISLPLSSPAHLQPLIAHFPETPFILLHSSYPYTRDAGYLCSVYRNAYVDFGEIFPFVNGEGQRDVIRQVLELCPTNKILWSTDGHWWPESYYLGSLQAREALYEVLSQLITARDLTEIQAIQIVKNALFHNSNRIYRLGLQPVEDILGEQ
ncbi:hypothetical protein JAAARDRAFT_135303 [Jaapia argillacea MUCL 33604]|uniref:Amidohydrolase-related domain-containing protein n=1 Tax=Jaapia argillacea MUCL 33604 TaxID=933084 RepID=A0A067PTB2_9AGAM|nr:hypothetical protein JAAARDRAFT_135303 [Jaapia argillacea MUCL 33604]